MVQKAVLIGGDLLEDSRFAPYEGDIVFIIDGDVIIHNEGIIEGFDVGYYEGIFDIFETVD